MDSEGPEGQLTVGLPPGAPKERSEYRQQWLKTGFHQGLHVKGSHQSLALFKDPNPIRLEMTRLQQTEIVRKTYFQIFPVTIAGKGCYDMPRRIHIYICIHRYKFQIQKSWTLSFWKGYGLHTRTSPTHCPAKAMKGSLHSYLTTILQSVCPRTVTDCSTPGIPHVQKCE